MEHYWQVWINVARRLKCNKGNAKRGISPRLKFRPCDLWPWKSIGSQIFLRSKYAPGLVKIHWRMLILGCSQGCYAVKIWPLEPLTLKINRVPDSPKDYVCTKFGQNPLKDVDSRVFTRMLRSKNLTRDIDLWPWKSIGFQTDGSVTISLRNFVGEGIIKSYLVCSTMQPAHELIIVW